MSRNHKGYIAIILILFSQITFCQTKKQKYFSSAEEYARFAEAKFDIKAEELYYISTAGDSSTTQGWSKMGQLVLITGDSIATIQEITTAMEMMCPPSKVIHKMTAADILRASSPGTGFQKANIKNLLSQELLSRINGEKLAVFVYSYRFGRWGQSLIKRRKEIAELGYMPVIILLDGADISNLDDIDKSPLQIN